MRIKIVLMICGSAFMLAPALLGQNVSGVTTNQPTKEAPRNPKLNSTNPVALPVVTPPSTNRRTAPPAAITHQGKLVAVDTKAMTMTVNPVMTGGAADQPNIVLPYLTNTYFLRSGKRTGVTNATVGEPVRYWVRTTPDGKTNLMWMMFGVQPPRTTGAPPTR
jgi:hypothetical protein